MNNIARIFLVGFMGSGKTTIGEKLSKMLDFNFIDTDNEVERLAGKTVSEIFVAEGEDFFREKEQQVLHHLIHETKILVSTGGGMPCFFDNMDVMNHAGLTIYLQATPELLQKRLTKLQNERPLLQSVPEESLLETLTALLQAREKYYQKAKISINAHNLQAKHVAMVINNFCNL